MRLRHTASECLSSLLDRYLQAQHTLRLLADTASLEKYYDIYDVSTDDLRKAGSALSELGLEDKHSLRSLRTLFAKLYTVRKSILCCLLALSADGGDSDIATWSSAVEEMRDLGVVTGRNITKMTRILSEQDRTYIPPYDRSPADQQQAISPRCPQPRRLVTIGTLFELSFEG